MKFKSNKKEVLEKMQRAEIRALEGIGVFVDGDATLRCPVGQYTDGTVGGNLRDSLDYKVNEAKKYVQNGTPVEYAPYVEKGTRNMGAQPFLTPAVEDNMAKIKKLAADLLKL